MGNAVTLKNKNKILKLRAEPLFSSVDYISVADTLRLEEIQGKVEAKKATLDSLGTETGGIVLAAAVRFNRDLRILDNLVIG